MNLNPWQLEQARQHWRRTRNTTCRDCNQPTITGPDRDRAALPTVIDPQPLDWAHELHQHLHHQPTYLLTENKELWDCRPHLPDKPWPGPGTIHARHRCHQEDR